MSTRNCVLCDEVRALIREWMTKKGGEACWYYPDIFEQIGRKLGMEITLDAPTISHEDFRDGCMRFAEQVYIGSRNHDDGIRVGDSPAPEPTP